MIAGLARFVVDLRQAGVRASPAEWIEALRAVEAVGLDDRERFRLALRCTLVKRSRQCELFDEIFERFFRTPGRAGRGGGRPAGAAAGRRRRPPAVRDLLERATGGAPHRSGRLRRVVLGRPAPEERAKSVSRLRAPAPVDPTRRDLSRRLDFAEELEISSRLPRIVEQIRLRTSRRHRRSAKGQLCLRRVFRENLTRDGVPFVLPRRRRPRRRSRVVLLIDVSWSTARAAGVFLSLAQEFLRRARETRLLFFVDRTIDGTAPVADWLRCESALAAGPQQSAARRGRPGCGIVRGGVSFDRLVESLPGLNLGAPSDYGRAFHTLLRSHHRPAGRDTVLLVLGDGRTNRFDSQDWAFEEISARCGAVLWLVPESLERWGSGDSALGEYLKHADIAVEAHDVVGLARGVAELTRKLGGRS